MKKTVFVFLILLIFSTAVFSGELLKITTISPNLDTAVANIGVSFLTDYNFSAGIGFPLIQAELFDSFSILGLYGFSFTFFPISYRTVLLKLSSLSGILRCILELL